MSQSPIAYAVHNENCSDFLQSGALSRVILFLCLSVCSLSALGQSVTGRVAETTGAVLAKARVRVRNQATNVEVVTVTSSSGVYTVPYLKPGVYSVTAVFPGFDTETKTDITLQTSQTVNIDFVMKVGSVAETINVSGTQLDRDKADVGEIVENERVNELPLNGGDMGQLAQLSAGTYYSGSSLYMRPFDNSVAAMSINGNQYGSNALMLDGVSNEAARGDAYNSVNSQMGYVAPVQSVQEFKVVTDPYDAMYGRLQGGAIDMTLKSGTNQIHGSVYEFARRAYLDANSWVNDYNKIAKPSHTRDQYGAELDGPVAIPKLYSGRDKTFFLAQFENWSEIFPQTQVDTVPEPQWLQGDFSDLQYYDSSTNTNEPIVLYDPLTTTIVNGTQVRQPFPTVNGKINQIPLDRLSPYAVALLSLYPAPNSAPRPQSTSYTGNYISPAPVTDTYRNGLFKIDQVIDSKDRLSLRYGYWERYEFQDQNGIPGEGAYGEYPHGERVNTFTPDWIHTFTPQLVFDFKASIIRRVNISGTGPTNYNLSSLGFSQSQIGQFGVYNDSVPYTSPSEFTQIGSGYGNYTIGNSLAMLPSVTWTKKSHTIHAGLDVRFMQQGYRYQTGGLSFSVDRTWTQNSYTSSSADSGNSIASLLLGTASSGSFTINPTLLFSQHYYAPFIQDDWKIRRNLTLNIGIRYDLNQPPTERHNKFDYTFNQNIANPVSAGLATPLKGGFEFPGVNGAPRSYNVLDTATFQPRLGLSWSPWDKLVVHGGFGIFFQNPNPGPSELGFSAQTQYVATNNGGVTPTMNLGVPANGANPATALNPFPTIIQPTGSSLGAETGLGQGLFYLNPAFAVPRTYQYSGGIQQQFAKHDMLEINYVGNRTVNSATSDDVDRESLPGYANCDPELGGNPANCAAPLGYVTNPFENVNGFQGTTYYTSSTIQALNLTRPFPEFADVTEYDINGGKSWYNSLQLTASHRVRKSLTVHGTWTWSKEMQSGGWADTNYRIPSRSIYSNDFAHRVTFSGFWLLPVGRGKMLLGHVNRVVDEAIGGWELSTIVTWQTGFPWGVGSNDYNGRGNMKRVVTPTTITGVNGTCRADWEIPSGQTTYQIVQHGSGSANCIGNDTFLAVPPYGINYNVVYSGIRDPGTEDWDASISKSFGIYERMHLDFRLDAFNVPNHPTFSGGYDTSVTDGTFGQIVKSAGQSNQPRNVQLTFKLIW
jgi:Carboxypeptidase regulatory-like domain